MTEITTTAALIALRECRSALLAAHLDALSAARRLSGARRTRRAELVDSLSDAIAHVERLTGVLESDER